MRRNACCLVGRKGGEMPHTFEAGNQARWTSWTAVLSRCGTHCCAEWKGRSLHVRQSIGPRFRHQRLVRHKRKVSCTFIHYVIYVLIMRRSISSYRLGEPFCQACAKRGSGSGGNFTHPSMHLASCWCSTTPTMVDGDGAQRTTSDVSLEQFQTRKLI